MFEVPEAKRVKRSRIFSFGSASSVSEDDERGLVASEKNDRDQRNSTDPDHHRSSKTIAQNVTHEQAIETNDDYAMVNYGFDYDFVDKILEVDNDDVKETAPKSQEDAKEQTFEFQLFQTNPKSNTLDPNDNDKRSSTPDQATQPNTSKITIRSPTPEASLLSLGLGLGLGSGTQQSGSILKPRPNSYYFTTNQQSQRLKSEYEQVALSNEDVINNRYSSKWQGTHLKWRVFHIKQSEHKVKGTTPAQEMHVPISGRSQTQTRTRPGKKRRIVMRRRVQMRRLLTEETKVAAQKAEEAQKEKRTRKNREKKVKKKEKEKMKKLEARDGPG